MEKTHRKHDTTVVGKTHRKHETTVARKTHRKHDPTVVGKTHRKHDTTVVGKTHRKHDTPLPVSFHRHIILWISFKKKTFTRAHTVLRILPSLKFECMYMNKLTYKTPIKVIAHIKTPEVNDMQKMMLER